MAQKYRIKSVLKLFTPSPIQNVVTMQKSIHLIKIFSRFQGTESYNLCNISGSCFKSKLMFFHIYLPLFKMKKTKPFQWGKGKKTAYLLLFIEEVQQQNYDVMVYISKTFKKTDWNKQLALVRLNLLSWPINLEQTGEIWNRRPSTDSEVLFWAILKKGPQSWSIDLCASPHNIASTKIPSTNRDQKLYTT